MKRTKEEKETAYVRCCHHLIEMIMKYGNLPVKESNEEKES